MIKAAYLHPSISMAPRLAKVKGGHSQEKCHSRGPFRTHSLRTPRQCRVKLMQRGSIHRDLHHLRHATTSLCPHDRPQLVAAAHLDQQLLGAALRSGWQGRKSQGKSSCSSECAPAEASEALRAPSPLARWHTIPGAHSSSGAWGSCRDGWPRWLSHPAASSEGLGMESRSPLRMESGKAFLVARQAS